MRVTSGADLQRIEDLRWQTTYRLSERSTSANVEVAGFKYSQVGGQLDWTFH